MVGADVKIAKIHQRVGDGLLIPLRALDCEHFPVAGFCVEKNSCAMLVVISHEPSVVSDQLSAFPDSALSTLKASLLP